MIMFEYLLNMFNIKLLSGSLNENIFHDIYKIFIFNEAALI